MTTNDLIIRLEELSVPNNDSDVLDCPIFQSGDSMNALNHDSPLQVSALLGDKIQTSLNYLLIPSNDTHVNWMIPLLSRLSHASFMIFTTRDENAKYYLEHLKIPFRSYEPGILKLLAPDVIILGNDWGAEEKNIIHEAKEQGIPSVCIQEGPLDFADAKVARMQHADYAFLQGPVMRNYLSRDNAIVTGNPKYDSLFEIALPKKPRVLINCNFTYGIFEDVRDQWVKDVVEACRALKVEFVISKHPRDKGVLPSDYPVLPSDAFHIRQQLEDSSIIVSRFSTVIYEMMMLGREAVYYNPHGEPFPIFSDDSTGGIWKATNRIELEESLQQCLDTLGRNNERRHEFLLAHCATMDHNSAARCAKEIQRIAETHSRIRIKNLRDRRSEKHTSVGHHKNEQEPFLSVVITTFNREKLLDRCLLAFTLQTLDKKHFEVIVVDDGSEKPVIDIVRKYESNLNVKYLYQQNAGLAAARNLGINAAKGSVIVPFDDDNYPHPDCLKAHYDFHVNHPATEHAMLAYQEWSPELEVTPLMHYITEVNPLFWCYQNLKDGQELPFGYLWGGCSSYKKAMAQKAGGFAKRFAFGYEDIEAELRMRKLGVRVFFNKSARNFVARGVTYKDFCQRLYKQGRSLYHFRMMYPDNAQVQAYTRYGNPANLVSSMSPLIENIEAGITKLLDKGYSHPKSEVMAGESLDKLYHLFSQSFDYWKSKGIVDAMEVVSEKTGTPAKAAACNPSICKTTTDERMKFVEQLEREGKIEEAIEAIKLVVAEDSDNADVLYKCAQLLQNIDQYAESLNQLKKVVQLNSRHCDAYNDLGVLYFHYGEHEKAVDNLTKALLTDTDGKAHRNLGKVLIQLGRYDEAMEVYKSLLNSLPDDPEALQTLRKLELALKSAVEEVETLSHYSDREKCHGAPSGRC